MKKIIGCVLLSLGLVFSSVSFAGIVGNFVGKGSSVEAVKSFNKAVASNDGIVSNQTDFSSVGKFGEYLAKVYVEEDGNGGVKIRITVTNEKKDLARDIARYIASGGKNYKMDIAVLIGKSMEKDGYKMLDD